MLITRQGLVRWPRHEQARLTREAMLEAARRLFLDRGYVGGTIDAIARGAAVSPETIYAVFGTKRAILSEPVDVMIAGGGNAPPILEQGWVQDMRCEPGPRRLSILAKHGRAILERRAPIDEVVRGAAHADAAIAELWERGKAQRFAGQLELLRIVAGEARLRDRMTVRSGADILYAIGSPETTAQPGSTCPPTTAAQTMPH